MIRIINLINKSILFIFNEVSKVLWKTFCFIEKNDDKDLIEMKIINQFQVEKDNKKLKKKFKLFKNVKYS